MKRLIYFIIAMVITGSPLLCQVKFDDYFIDATMRIDYYHIGDAKTEIITLDKIYKQDVWAGSKKNLLDNFNIGRYYVKIYDSATDDLIYSRGFDSYFGEYKTTGDAIGGIKRTYHESARIPYPKNKIKFILEVRNRENKLNPIFTQEIDPSSISIIKEKRSPFVQVYPILSNGPPADKVDIAIVAEGYMFAEEKKVIADLEWASKTLFDQEPFKSYKDRFNVWGVVSPSAESGTDEPRAGIFKNTAVSTTFNSLGSERYLLTEDNKSLRDIAGHTPYDYLIIMVNSKRYGGGGIYNFYCTFTSDNQWQPYLLVHEFGHHFVGLADEYYTSSTAYNEFYPEGIEPVEPNITRLLDPGNLKWKNLVKPGTEIPTPWEKDEFDKMDTDYQKIRSELNDKIAKMKREGADKKEIAKEEELSERLSKENAVKVDDYLNNSKFKGIVGAYEGAGYCSKNMYRPEIDCIMFTKGKKPFCIVCEAAIIEVIKYYTE